MNWYSVMGRINAHLFYQIKSLIQFKNIANVSNGIITTKTGEEYIIEIKKLEIKK